MARHADQAIVALPVLTPLLLGRFDNADESAAQNAPSRDWGVYQHQDIERIAVTPKVEEIKTTSNGNAMPSGSVVASSKQSQLES
jgi:hypothetical protein